VKTIYKYTLTLKPNILNIPKGAVFLCVGIQHRKGLEGQPNISAQIWFLVDPSMPTESRVIDVYGTGEAMPDNPGQYLGTFLVDDGRFVWHVFEERN
jgi:hypothetical protein